MSTTTEELRVGVVGTALMGADHVARLTTTITGAGATAIVEPDNDRAQAAVSLAPSASVFTRIEDAIEADAVDA